MAAFLKRGKEMGTEEIDVNTGTQGGLDLDTEMLQKDENMSTSLCDRFGIHMYSEEFIEKEKAYQTEQKEKNDQIFTNVWNNKKQEKSEQAFQSVMHAQTAEVIKAEYTGPGEAEGTYAGVMYGLLGAVLAGAVLFGIEKYRRKRHEDHHNI